MASSVVTVGDSSIDRFLEVAEQEASLLCDIKHRDCSISFKYGEKIPVQHIHLGCGGSALNCAVGFSRLGLQSSIATIVGEDDEANKIVELLSLSNVNFSHSRKGGHTNQSTIIIYKNERTILSYHAPHNYHELKIPRTNWLYFASAGKGCDALIPQVNTLAAGGTKIAFNPGSWELKNFDLFRPLLRISEILILNQSEADLIIGELEAKQQLKKMLNLGVKVAVITDGANGAYFAKGAQMLHMGTMASPVVDPTGAGDSFSSGFVAGIILGNSIEESAKWGMVNANSVIDKIGANAGLLDLNEIKKESREAKSLKASVI